MGGIEGKRESDEGRRDGEDCFCLHERTPKIFSVEGVREGCPLKKERRLGCIVPRGMCVRTLILEVIRGSRD